MQLQSLEAEKQGQLSPTGCLHVEISNISGVLNNIVSLLCDMIRSLSRFELLAPFQEVQHLNTSLFLSFYSTTKPNSSNNGNLQTIIIIK